MSSIINKGKQNEQKTGSIHQGTYSLHPQDLEDGQKVRRSLLENTNDFDQLQNLNQKEEDMTDLESPPKQNQKKDRIQFKEIDEQETFHFDINKIDNDDSETFEDDNDNDKSFNNNSLNQVNKYSHHHEKLNYIIGLLPALPPSHKKILAWNISILILTFLQFLFIPIKIAFTLSLKEVNNIGLYILPVIYSFINIIICANMGYYSNGQIITNKYQIVNHYVKGEFWYDFIPTIALILTEERDELIYFVYLEILRIFQLRTLVTKVEFHFNLYERFPTSTRLLKLLFIIISIAHYTACGFIYIGRYQEENPESWIHIYSTNKGSQQYIDAFYYSVITMSTVGYGDISPSTNSEKIYGIINTIISCGVFGYALNSVGTIFSDLEQKNTKVRYERYKLLKYLKSKQVKNKLQVKALNYLSFVHQIEEENDFTEGKMVLNKISQSIQEQIIKNQYIKILQSLPFFRNNFSDQFLHKICLLIQENQFAPGESIIESNQVCENIFLVLDGQIQIQFQRTDTCQNDYLQNFQTQQQFAGPYLEKGTIFGMNSIFKEQSQGYSVVSKSLSQIGFLQKKDFHRTLLDFPIDKEIYKDLKEQYLLNLYEPELCFFCKKIDHSLLACPFQQYKPNSNLIISKFNYIDLQQQKVSYSIYRDPRKFNALKIRNSTSQSLKIFRIQNAFNLKSQELMDDFDPNFYDEIKNYKDDDFYDNFPVYQFQQYELEDQSYNQVTNDTQSHLNNFQHYLLQQEEEYLNQNQQKVQQLQSLQSIMEDKENNNQQFSIYQESKRQLSELQNNVNASEDDLSQMSIPLQKKQKMSLIVNNNNKNMSDINSLINKCNTNARRTSLMLMNNTNNNQSQYKGYDRRPSFSNSNIQQQNSYIGNSQLGIQQNLVTNQNQQSFIQKSPNLRKKEKEISFFDDNNQKSNLQKVNFIKSNKIINFEGQKYSQLPNKEDQVIDSTQYVFKTFKPLFNYDRVLKKLPNSDSILENNKKKKNFQKKKTMNYKNISKKKLFSLSKSLNMNNMILNNTTFQNENNTNSNEDNINNSQNEDNQQQLNNSIYQESFKLKVPQSTTNLPQTYEMTANSFYHNSQNKKINIKNNKNNSSSVKFLNKSNNNINNNLNNQISQVSIPVGIDQSQFQIEEYLGLTTNNLHVKILSGNINTSAYDITSIKHDLQMNSSAKQSQQEVRKVSKFRQIY